MTACQPELCRIDPARNDTAAVAAKTKKSFMPCALLRSAGVWQSVTTAVAPMKLKFQPMPSSASEPQKWDRPSPPRATTPEAASSTMPTAVTRSLP